MVIPISKLRVGQRFSWIPREWYGPGKLISKTRRVEIFFDYDAASATLVPRKRIEYDLKFDAAVINPPGVIYGVLSTTKVRLLAPKRKTKSKSK